MAVTSPEQLQAPSYPPLADSPYRVADTPTRERWWYSDGIWLDQGPTAGVIGFVWVHWLADRGVQLRDGRLDEGYAHDLYRAARRDMGQPEDVDGGAYVGNGARVLLSRGLVEQCYSCPDAPQLLGALLERGPVVAGVNWFTSFDSPRQVGGWTLCRKDPDAQVRGGHCVLLNGVTLDTTIDGVKGFVRFKNSWGRGWGDRGHALISIDDLMASVAGGEILLAIPSAMALQPGLHQDVGTEEPAYGPAVVHYEQEAIGGDSWTTRDTVGVTPYANAIARGIQHPMTKPPLTIGIKGQWGAGKTSLMRMIRDRLEWPGQDGPSGKRRRIHLKKQTVKRLAVSKNGAPQEAKDLGEVTNYAALRKVKSYDPRAERSSPDRPTEKLEADLGPADADTAPDADTTPEDKDRWRPTVWFNPWMYQTGEQVWAGLAHEIIDQVTDRMSRAEQEHFWLHLNLKRVDEQALRRKIYGLLLERVLPYVVVGAVLLIGGLVVAALGGASWVVDVLTAGGPAFALIAGGLQSASVLRSRVTGDLSGLVQPTTSVGRVAGQQLADLYSEVVESPNYRAQTGALALVHADIQRVLDLVATRDRPLVVFVDDLDRCTPGTVVQVIEAINLFVAGDYPNSIFVISMEPEMVAAHVEAVYGDLAEKLEQTNGTQDQAFDLGWRFLEKIVQLPLALPAMGPNETSVLFKSLFAREVDSGAPPPPAAQGANGQASAAQVELVGAARPGTALKEPVRPRDEKRLSTDDPEVQEVIDHAQRCLNRNPREIKRFVNLFRFYTMIYMERRQAHLPTPSSLHEVGKLAVLGIRWPSLLGVLALNVGDDDDERTVFEFLEDAPGHGKASWNDAALKRKLAAAGVSEKTIERLMSSELKAFLRSQPRVGAGVRGFL